MILPTISCTEHKYNGNLKNDIIECYLRWSYLVQRPPVYPNGAVREVAVGLRQRGASRPRKRCLELLHRSTSGRAFWNKFTNFVDFRNEHFLFPNLFLFVKRKCQVFQAVDHLHAHDLIHCDIKTENIFLTKDYVCKLGDFGLIFDSKNVPVFREFLKYVSEIFEILLQFIRSWYFYLSNDICNPLKYFTREFPSHRNLLILIKLSK